MKLWHLTVPVILKEKKKIWFPQDDLTLQTTQHVTDWQHQTFNGHFISFETANVWHSPDLGPLDFFLW